MKKTLEAPKLVVLVRSHPEESLITACKYHPMPVPSGPQSAFDGCEIPFPEICPWCEEYAAS